MIARNTAANAVGLVATLSAQLAVLFGSFRLVGPEQYGLIGIFSTVLTAAAIFDVGLGQTVVREVSRRRHEMTKVRPVVLGFALIYAVIVTVLVATFCGVAPFLAQHWLRPASVSSGEISAALQLIAIAVGIQRLRGVFQTTLDGLEMQVLGNKLLASTSILRAVLGLGVLFIYPTARAFFVAQIIASIIETALFALGTLRQLPASPDNEAIDLGAALGTGRFAVLNASAAALGTFLQVVDSVVISALVPLSTFGRYSLVSSMCQVMLRLSAPILNAIYPRLASYVAQSERQKLKDLYFASSRIATTVLAISACSLSIYGWAFLSLVSDAEMADQFWPVLTFLSLAYSINGLARLPHGLQLASGHPEFALWINGLVGMVYLPAIFYFTPKYGVVAPAASLLIANLLGLSVFIVITARYVSEARVTHWLKTVITPYLISAAMFLAAAAIIAPNENVTAAIATCVLTGALSLGANLMLSRREVRLFFS